MALWLNRRSVDWLLGGAAGVGVRIFLVSRIHLGQIGGPVRFSVYAAVAAAILAFVAIAFTPLAILSSLGTGRSIDRLRALGPSMRRSFVGGTLVLLVCAIVLVGCGASDATSQGDAGARWIASIAIGVSGAKVLRISRLFTAILSATDQDFAKSNRSPRTKRSA